MTTNKSPWIQQLHNNRTPQKLNSDTKTDIIIIGAGIAGISTAFHILESTDKNVVILEAKKFAHGATGHNAGQLSAYFERPFSEIVAEFGLELAGQAVRSIEIDAWNLLRHMHARTGSTADVFEFMGYTGIPSREYLDVFIATNHLRIAAGCDPYQIWIDENSDVYGQLSDADLHFVTQVPLQKIKTALKTSSDEFFACLLDQKGCSNSARLCEDIVEYLEQQYPDRFALYEHSPVQKVVLHDATVVASTEHHTVDGDQVVLCTNGFEHFTILSAQSGLSVDANFHRSVIGQAGTMIGYLESEPASPAAMSYLEGKPVSFDENEEYYYATHRPYQARDGQLANLVSVGGPVTYLPNMAEYEHDSPVNQAHVDRLTGFIENTYGVHPDREYHFTWHGLMGYTQNGIRMIGPDPRDSKLLYNLGCNGVGLLPSIFGANRIARYIRKEKTEPSVFDVKQG